MSHSTKNILKAFQDGERDKRNKLPSKHKQYKKEYKKAYVNGYKSG
jgi:hypothetical protein